MKEQNTHTGAENTGSLRNGPPPGQEPPSEPQRTAEGLSGTPPHPPLPQPPRDLLAALGSSFLPPPPAQHVSPSLRGADLGPGLPSPAAQGQTPRCQHIQDRSLPRGHVSSSFETKTQCFIFRWRNGLIIASRTRTSASTVIRDQLPKAGEGLTSGLPAGPRWAAGALLLDPGARGSCAAGPGQGPGLWPRPWDSRDTAPRLTCNHPDAGSSSNSVLPVRLTPTPPRRGAQGPPRPPHTACGWQPGIARALLLSLCRGGGLVGSSTPSLQAQVPLQAAAKPGRALWPLKEGQALPSTQHHPRHGPGGDKRQEGLYSPRPTEATLRRTLAKETSPGEDGRGSTMQRRADQTGRQGSRGESNRSARPPRPPRPPPTHSTRSAIQGTCRSPGPSVGKPLDESEQAASHGMWAAPPERGPRKEGRRAFWERRQEEPPAGAARA